MIKQNQSEKGGTDKSIDDVYRNVKPKVELFTDLFTTSINIPPYQRNYTWSEANCKQLCEDLFKMLDSDPGNKVKHFFGTVVYTVDSNGEYSIIDGQQRIISISLFAIALRNSINDDDYPASESTKNELHEILFDREGNLRLSLKSRDQADFLKLIRNGPGGKASPIHDNYSFFKGQIDRFKSKYRADALLSALNRLEIISITVKPGVDNPQEIFDSINSKMEELTDADRIRNYLLMFRPPDEQKRAYEEYWSKIEDDTGRDLMRFLSIFVAIKCNYMPGERTLYRTFKDEFGAAVKSDSNAFFSFLAEMRKYSSLFSRLLGPAPVGQKKIDDMLDVLKYLKFTFSFPFVLRVLKDYEERKINTVELSEILVLLRSYLIRNELFFANRSVRGNHTNSMCHLYEKISQLPCDVPFIGRMKYVLSKKAERTKFVTDDELRGTLSVMNLYESRFLCVAVLSILEDSNSAESALKRYQSHVLSIEHIMPQELTGEWKAHIGPGWAETHSDLVGNLGNLTFTAFNSNLGRKPFEDKRDDPQYGYSNSGLRINRTLSKTKRWDRGAIIGRQQSLVEDLIRLLPALKEVPALDPSGEFSVETLSMSEDFQGRQLRGYIFDGYKNDGYDKSLDVFVGVMRELNALYPASVRELKIGKGTNELIKKWQPNLNHRFKPIGGGLVVNTNFVVVQLVSLIAQVFDTLDIDSDRLEFITVPNASA